VSPWYVLHRISCYRIPVGHPIVVSPPGVHAETNKVAFTDEGS